MPYSMIAQKSPTILAPGGAEAVRRNLQDSVVTSGINVLGISRHSPDSSSRQDLFLKRIVLESGAVAGKGGWYCDGDETIFIQAGDPLVCVAASGSAADISTAIVKVFDGSTSIPLDAKCLEE